MKERKARKVHWIFKQRREASKFFAPKIRYDKKYDILYIGWFPKKEYKFSIETKEDIVFDMHNNKDGVKGIEIFDFKRKFMKS